MELQGWGRENTNSDGAAPTADNKIVLDEEDEDWELVDNSEIHINN